MDDILALMLTQAKKAYHNAYVPNSHFGVGAAICTEDKNIYSGANVENACYAMGQCAEASALGAMISQQGNTLISAVVLVAKANFPIVPCGGCLQKLSEFAGPETQVHCYTLDGQHKQYRFTALQPVFFDHQSMES